MTSPVRHRARAFLLVCCAATLSLAADGLARPSVTGVRFDAAWQAEPAPANSRCPVLPDEVVDPEFFSDYRGSRIYFCCRKCLRTFESAPERYLSNLPAGLVESVGDVVEVPSGDALDPPQGAETDEPAALHDHSHHEDVGERTRRWLARVGRLHPASVHFPIALLMSAALAELLALRTKSARFDGIIRFCLWLGVAGAVGAGALGWADAVGVGDSYAGFPATLLEVHRWIGTATAILAVLVLVSWEASHRRASQRLRAWSRTFVFLAALLVGASGYLGAELIYGWNHLFE